MYEEVQISKNHIQFSVQEGQKCTGGAKMNFTPYNERALTLRTIETILGAGNKDVNIFQCIACAGGSFWQFHPRDFFSTGSCQV